MRKTIGQPAIPGNLKGPQLPPIVLNISSRLQFCAGTAAAVSFFDELNSIGMHDHIAASMQAFLSSLRSAIAAGTVPGLARATVQ